MGARKGTVKWLLYRRFPREPSQFLLVGPCGETAACPGWDQTASADLRHRKASQYLLVGLRGETV
jgi:hypothetical protein